MRRILCAVLVLAVSEQDGVRVQGAGLDLDRQAFYNIPTEFGKCE